MMDKKEEIERRIAALALRYGVNPNRAPQPRPYRKIEKEEFEARVRLLRKNWRKE